MSEHSHHQADSELLDTQRGLWVTKVSFLAIVVTVLVQGIIAFISGSAALLADTIHGFGNAATTLPLLIAFSLSRKRATPQFTYGYHRAEDLAGIFILILIAVSGALVGYESIDRLVHEREPDHIPWAIAAGLVGFVINEGIAQYRMRVGKQIGSAALVADGHHARVDGLGSLAVVVGLISVSLGFTRGDPLAGLTITGLIALLLVKEAGPTVLSRVMDRIDPSIVSQVRDEALQVSGVIDAYEVRARWAGHRLASELTISVDAHMTVAQGHRVAEEVQARLLHSLPKLEWCSIHVEPNDGGTNCARQLDPHRIESD